MKIFARRESRRRRRSNPLPRPTNRLDGRTGGQKCSPRPVSLESGTTRAPLLPAVRDVTALAQQQWGPPTLLLFSAVALAEQDAIFKKLCASLLLERNERISLGEGGGGERCIWSVVVAVVAFALAAIVCSLCHCGCCCFFCFFFVVGVVVFCYCRCCCGYCFYICSCCCSFFVAGAVVVGIAFALATTAVPYVTAAAGVVVFLL